MWHEDSAATSASSGFTRSGSPRYSFAADPGTVAAVNLHSWARLYV